MKLLIVTSRFPYPLEKGDKLRIFHQIRELSKFHQIYLFSLNNSKITEQQLNELKPYCSGIKVHQFAKQTPYLNTVKSLWNGLPFQVNMFINKASKNDFINFVRKVEPHHIYCQLIRTSEYGKLISALPKTLDYMDCFSDNMLSRKQKANFLARYFLNYESNTVAKYEKQISKHFNSTTIISEADNSKINNKSTVVPNGVDFNHFKPTATEKNIDLLFVGNLNYPPNVDACQYIANKVLPKLINDYPHIKIVFAGAEPNKKVKVLANQNIEVTGWTEDIREYYNQAKIFIAPMQLGTGLQNKILEAMAMQIPVITSEIVNKSIQAAHNELIECNSLADYISAINLLLNNPDKVSSLKSNALQFVKQNFSWQKHTSTLKQLF